MKRFTPVSLLLLATLAAPAAVPDRGEDERREPARSSDAPPAARPGHLRGTGMLILDPRDSPEMAKERLRRLLEEIRPHIPEHMRQEANRLLLEAFLAADWTRPETLPELAFVFHEDMTAEMLHRFIMDTPTGRASEEYCRSACALDRVFDDEGVHIHLTRPFGGPGDSVLAVEFYESAGPGGIPKETLDAEVLEFRNHLRDHWEEFGYDREPIGRIFGVRVVIGDPKVGEDWMPPE